MTSFDDFSKQINEAKPEMNTKECAALDKLHASMTSLHNVIQKRIKANPNAKLPLSQPEQTSKQPKASSPAQVQSSNFYKLYQSALASSRELIKRKPQTFIDEVSLLTMSVDLMTDTVSNRVTDVNIDNFIELLNQINAIISEENIRLEQQSNRCVKIAMVSGALAVCVVLGNSVVLPVLIFNTNFSIPAVMGLDVLSVLVATGLLMCAVVVSILKAIDYSVDSELNLERTRFFTDARKHYDNSRQKALPETSTEVHTEEGQVVVDMLPM